MQVTVTEDTYFKESFTYLVKKALLHYQFSYTVKPN